MSIPLYDKSIVLFKRMTDRGMPKVPSQSYEGEDAGWDLYLSRTVSIPPGQFMDLHTDVSVAMPKGVWGRITGRSSTLRKYGLLVQEGIIDNGYRDELCIGAWNLNRDEEIVLQTGTRIAQIIFHPIIPVVWHPVQELPGSKRGKGGFGSTGR